MGARQGPPGSLASVAVLAAVTVVWKISIHCAVAAGSVAILALRDHTTAQVTGGIVLGTAAALAYQTLSPLPA
jgi:hypothetical protein